jgi:hypothetical protein
MYSVYGSDRTSKKADKKYEPQRLMLQKRKGKGVLHTRYKDMVLELEGRNTLCD